MKDITINKSAELVRSILEISPVKAGEKFEEIASVRGDGFALQVLGRMAPLEIARIVREFDFTKSTIISSLASPEQVAGLLEVEPLYWQRVSSRWKGKELLAIQADAMSLLFSILLEGDDLIRRSRILEKIAGNGSAFFYLLLPFIGFDLSSSEEDGEGTPGHLYEVIREASPHIANKIAHRLRGGG